MKRDKFKMFTAERVAMLLLAISLIIWAIVKFGSSHSSHSEPLPMAAPIDSASLPVADSTISVNDSVKTSVIVPKKKNNRSKKNKSGKSKKSKSKPKPKQRDHLSEPVNKS